MGQHDDLGLDDQIKFAITNYIANQLMIEHKNLNLRDWPATSEFLQNLEARPIREGYDPRFPPPPPLPNPLPPILRSEWARNLGLSDDS